MDLIDIGGFPGFGRYWFWDRESGFLIDVIDSGGESGLWVRCVAGFRLEAQGGDGRELWVRNLSKMTRYLQDSFRCFRVSVDFSEGVSPRVTGLKEEGERLGSRADSLIGLQDDLKDRVSSLERSLDLDDGGDASGFDDVVERRYDEALQELQSVESELDEVINRLEFLNDLQKSWERSGYGLAVCFSVGTGFESTSANQFKTVVSAQLEQLRGDVDRSIKQKLSGENFRLKFTELDTPHQVIQHMYTPLSHPENDVSDSDLASLMSMYMAFAAEDIEVEGAVREESKAAAAQSVNAVFQHLESAGAANVENIESSGPLIGNVSGSEMTFGIDPADQPHFYIVGSTGSGKSYTKRMVLENCLALGYDVVSVTPRDLQAVSAFKGFDGDGGGLTGNYYLPGSDLLLDSPNDFKDLFNGSSFVSLRELSPSERSDWVKELFDSAAELGSTGNPVFVFLDEAHLFSSGDVAESIQRAIREVRKFGVHIVLVTQSPMDFNRKYKHIRENTVGNFFLQGEYWDYAQRYLNSEDDITDLAQGSAWFTGRGFSPVLLDVRKPLSRVEEVEFEELKELNEFYSGSPPSLETLDTSVGSEEAAGSLNNDQEEVLQAIRRYIKTEDELPSKNKVIDCSPFGSSKTPRLLSELKEMDVVGTESAQRYGNEATVFKILE